MGENRQPDLSMTIRLVVVENDINDVGWVIHNEQVASQHGGLRFLIE